MHDSTGSNTDSKGTFCIKKIQYTLCTHSNTNSLYLNNIFTVPSKSKVNLLF